MSSESAEPTGRTLVTRVAGTEREEPGFGVERVIAGGQTQDCIKNIAKRRGLYQRPLLTACPRGFSGVCVLGGSLSRKPAAAP